MFAEETYNDGFESGYASGRHDMKQDILTAINERISTLFDCDANEKQMVAVMEAKAIIEIIKSI